MKCNPIGCMFAAAMLMGTAFASAQKPVYNIITDRTHGGSLEQLSDNGEWAVGYGKSDLDELGFSYPRLYNVKTHETINLYTAKDATSIKTMMATDVTNDGQKVVGQFNGQPAMWTAEKEKWTVLPVSVNGFTGGSVECITPDGKYALGTATAANGWNETLILWDLSGTEPKDITPDNLPLPISMSGTRQSYEQIRGCDLAPDGSMFTGLVAYSYMGESWTFVYDVKANTWKGIGFDVAEQGRGYSFTKTGTGYLFTEGGQFRHGTNQIVGYAYAESDQEAVYTYDITTGKIEIVADSQGKLFGAVDNDGVIYASSPAGNPIRDWFAKVGDYWYDFKLITRQIWDTEWKEDVVKDEYGFSGTVVNVADNGKVIIANEYSNSPYDTYLIELPNSIAEVAPKVNLLGNYYVTPVNNASFAVLKEVRVTFDRAIDICGEFNAVKLVDSKGNTVANSINIAKAADDNRILSVTFRNRRLDVGETYKVVIPAGVVNIAGDTSKKNAEISVSYKGRPDAPVAPVSVSPEPGMAISTINAASNPISVRFDSDIAVVEKEGGSMWLYQLNDDNTREKIAQLSGSITGSLLQIFPVMEQKLAKGTSYEIVIEANTVADISGSDPNEEYTIRYEGAYEPPAVIDEYIFTDNFNGGISSNNWMVYDGDMLEPAEEPRGWDFAAGVAWWIARDSELSSDMAAVSHSMYATPGKSNDWLVTNRLYINDDSAVLSFKSQGYRKDNEDRLKVYVLATDDIYTALTESTIEKFLYNGDLIYDEIQDPGANEETLAGDWTENSIKLDKYAGKNIYIAFLNDNRNQSAVFLEDVEVKRDVKFTYTNLTPESGLQREEITVKGIVRAMSETDTFKGYKLLLLDEDGNELSKLEDANVEIKKGWEMDVEFPETLKVPVGKEFKYTVDITLGDVNESVNLSFKNLAVQTTKRVVVEKYTGTTCPNCPLGIIALDILERDFEDLIIPIAYHCYPGDRFSSANAVAMNEFLGMNAAPTGRINRGPIAGPIWRDNNSGEYYYTNNATWYDYVVEEFNELAPADVVINRVDYNEANDSYDFDGYVKYALDMANQNVSLLAVVTENGLSGYQDNNLGSVESDVIGEWGNGGKYSDSSVPYRYNDVMRTYEGNTFNGTGGYVPATVEAGKEYTFEISVPNIRNITDPKKTSVTLMMINAESGRVINAVRVNTGEAKSVECLPDAAAGSDIRVNAVAGQIEIAAAGYAEAAVYTIDGSLIATGAGENNFAVSAGAHKGIAVVIVKGESGSKAVKVMIR